jgi:polyisoprenoid-binding protein YceI
MNKLLLSAALSISSLALASTWDIDSTHASANFTVKHLMVANVSGSLGQVTGKVELDDKDVTKSKVEATIDVKSIDTKNAKRDEHLRGKDFFEVEKFPSITFKSTKIEKAGEKFKITGDLTMHGVTKPVTLDTEISAEVVDPWKNVKRAVSATGTINRKDFGLVWQAALANNGVVVSEDVKLFIDVELNKAAAPVPQPVKK